MDDDDALEAIAFVGTELKEGATYVITVAKEFSPDAAFMRALNDLFQEVGAKAFLLFSDSDVRIATDEEAAYLQGYEDGLRSS